MCYSFQVSLYTTIHSFSVQCFVLEKQNKTKFKKEYVCLRNSELRIVSS